LVDSAGELVDGDNMRALQKRFENALII
jgi:hypothetical protein